MRAVFLNLGCCLAIFEASTGLTRYWYNWGKERQGEMNYASALYIITSSRCKSILEIANDWLDVSDLT